MRGVTFFHGLSTIPRVRLKFVRNVRECNEHQQHWQTVHLTINAQNIRVPACGSEK